MTVSSLAIAVCTSRRPARLGAMIDSLRELQPIDVPWRLIVVDNPKSHETEGVVKGAAADLDVLYVGLESAGIASARNAAISAAAEMGVQALAFIDDDERADPGWLVGLWAAHREHPEAVIAGTTRTVLPDGADEWIERSGLADRPEYPSGVSLPHCPTCNVLIPLGRIGDSRFDSRFDSTGGEDTDFFLRLASSGVEIRSSAQALVFEDWSPERATSTYLRQLALRKSAIYATIEIERRGIRGVIRVAASAGWNLEKGGLLALGGLMLRDRALRERAAVSFCNARGKTAVLLGKRPVEKPDWN